jgi:hypothetical protein
MPNPQQQQWFSCSGRLRVWYKVIFIHLLAAAALCSARCVAQGNLSPSVANTVDQVAQDALRSGQIVGISVAVGTSIAHVTEAGVSFRGNLRCGLISPTIS